MEQRVLKLLARPAHLRALCMAACLLLCTCVHSARQETSSLINFANDFANALTSADLKALETQLVELNRSNRCQVAVAIHSRLPEGTAPEDATELADRMLVGSAVENRGLVFFVFLAEHVVRIEVGYGLEGLVPDAHAHRIAETAARRIAKGEMGPALRDAIAGLAPVLQSLAPINQESTRWEWLPDIILASADATRGVVFFITHRREIPKQLASWWKSNDEDSRDVVKGIGAILSLFVLCCLRPVVGTALCMALPPAWILRRATYWTFFWGTDAAYGKLLKPGSLQEREKTYGLFDLLYYSFAIFVVAGCVMGFFIMFVGHPGGFGGAGAWARW